MTTSPNTPRVPQITAELRKAIRDGEYRPGHQLPSARALAERFQVARGTANSAMAELIREGLVVSRPRAGWFVADLAEITEVHRASAPGNRPRAIDRVSAHLANQAEADELGVRTGTPLIEIHRTEHDADGNLTAETRELLPAVDHVLVYELPATDRAAASSGHQHLQH